MPDIDLWKFTTAHPLCDHCGTVAAAITEWPAEIHLTCPCICHQHKAELIRNPSTKGKRRKGGR